MSAPQLYNVVVCLETLIFLVVDKENVLKNPRPYKICQHNMSQKECQYSSSSGEPDGLCLTEGDVKYKLVRFSVDSIDLHLVERSSALRFQLVPLRFSTCNLHGQRTKQGVTALVKQINLQQFVNSNFPLSRSDLETDIHHQDIWVESGSVKLGPVYVEGSLAGQYPMQNTIQEHQNKFLKKHDSKTKRLWFLWSKSELKESNCLLDFTDKCGCVGGKQFLNFFFIIINKSYRNNLGKYLFFIVNAFSLDH